MSSCSSGELRVGVRDLQSIAIREMILSKDSLVILSVEIVPSWARYLLFQPASSASSSRARACELRSCCWSSSCGDVEGADVHKVVNASDDAPRLVSAPGGAVVQGRIALAMAVGVAVAGGSATAAAAAAV